MKTRVILAVCVLMATVSLAQNQKINEVEVSAPKFQSELYKSVNDFLNSNAEYTSELKNTGIQGTEVIAFVVSPKGEISDYEVINSVSPAFDKVVIDLLESTNGKWNPGTANGKQVEMKTEVSVAFFLHSADDMIKTARHYQEKGNFWMFTKNNPEKARKYYNRGITLLPNEESLLAMRSLCSYEMGNINEAEKDWNRIKTLANNNKNSEFDLENFAEFSGTTKGFTEMMKTIKK